MTAGNTQNNVDGHWICAGQPEHAFGKVQTFSPLLSTLLHHRNEETFHAMIWCHSESFLKRLKSLKHLIPHNN